MLASRFIGELGFVGARSPRPTGWEPQPLPSFTVFINRQVQETAVDIAKIALGELPAALKKSEAKIIAMIHDEIIIEVPEANAVEAARMLQQTMEGAGRKVLKQIPIVAEARITDSLSEK